MWKSLKNLFGAGGAETPPNPAPPDAEKPALQPKGRASPPAPPDLTPYYDELGLQPGADLNAVRRAWKQALRQVHIDHYSDDPDARRLAEGRARRVNEAYRALQEALF